jgi:hypothetical protein
MGSIPSFRSAVLFDPADSDAAALSKTISKWTSFYKKWRALRPSGAPGLLTSTLIHVHRPDSRSLEAVVHVTADTSAPERAMAVFINPTAKDVSRNCTLPLYYAGLAPGTAVTATPLDFVAYETAATTDAWPFFMPSSIASSDTLIPPTAGAAVGVGKLRGSAGNVAIGTDEGSSSHVVGSDGAGFTDIVVSVVVRANSYAAVLVATSTPPGSATA